MNADLLPAYARLVTAVQDLSLARSLPQVQEIVRTAARRIANSDGATMVLRERDHCFYADEDAIAPLWKGRRFPTQSCVSGWSMRHGASVVIPDIYADERVPIDAYRPTFVRSLVIVPIRPEAPLGAIGVYWACERRASDEEVELLQSLANTTAVALENVQVYAELEHRVAARTLELEAANRELEAFSSAVSHDLRSSLRTINGHTFLLGEALDSSTAEQVRPHLAGIQRSTEQIHVLIESLLRLARFSAADLHRRRVDLAELAHGIVARLRAESGERSVEVKIAEKLETDCDEELMSIVLDNLLSNAWKFTSRTTPACVEVGCEERAQGEASAFFVRDNGAGFDPTRASRLFEPFQRFHSTTDFPGTGVGLATVQRIVQRHGGRIWAESSPGAGATFRFTCPAQSVADGAGS